MHSPFKMFFGRFSLLLLEPGEIYFEDFSVFYYPSGLSEEEAIKRYMRESVFVKYDVTTRSH